MNKSVSSYIEVYQEGIDDVNFIGFDSASGGYPYLKWGIPEFNEFDFMDKYFESLIQSVGKYSNMSDGSSSIDYDIRILGQLSNTRRHATVKVRLFNVVSFSDGIKTELIKEVKIFMREGSGFADRHLTESKIIGLTNNNQNKE